MVSWLCTLPVPARMCQDMPQRRCQLSQAVPTHPATVHGAQQHLVTGVPAHVGTLAGEGDKVPMAVASASHLHLHVLLGQSEVLQLVVVGDVVVAVGAHGEVAASHGEPDEVVLNSCGTGKASSSTRAGTQVMGILAVGTGTAASRDPRSHLTLPVPSLLTTLGEV